MSRRPKKKKKAPKKKHKPQDTTTLSGWLLLVASIIIGLSLVSFTSGAEKHHLLGLMGETIGWAFLAVFGISSYLVCIAMGWVGWRMLFNKSINHPFSKATALFIATSSLSMLFSLVEDQFPSLGTVLGQLFFPNLWEQNFRYHLGGAPFYYLYRDLPHLNLFRMFNTFGVGMIFLSTLTGSLLYLAKFSPTRLLPLFRPIKDWWNRPRKKRSIPMAKPVLKERPTLSSKMPARKPVVAEPEPEPEPFVPPPRAIKPPPEPKKPALTRKEAAFVAQRVYNGDFTEFKLPEKTMLTDAKKVNQSQLNKDLERQAEVLEETLHSFGIDAKVGQINCGPTVTSFEVHPAIGVKVQKVKALESDIALNMEAKSIRILAPIPGKAAIGIEVPNPSPQEVGFKDLLAAYQKGKQEFHIPLLLGKTVSGEFVMHDLAKMPHCIIAGATGSGKSVCINTIVMSILMNARPDEVKIIMVDPKKVELTPYTNLPHMLAPVITEPGGACTALHWLVKEMEKRYELLKKVGVRNINAFNNRKVDKELEESLGIEIPDRMYYIVGIIDELADLMMVSSHDIETPIARIAQMARAVGIHMILATQRPSREVITGLIKANFPTRISFKVSSRINSQIILDQTGAESLLGNGDMLMLPQGQSHLVRAQGAFIRDEDINAVIKHICDQAPTNYVIDSFDEMPDLAAGLGGEGGIGDEPEDSMYTEAYDVVTSTGTASTTFLQRKLKIGYARAASLMDELETRGVVGPADGARGRKVLVLGGDEAESEELVLEESR